MPGFQTDLSPVTAALPTPAVDRLAEDICGWQRAVKHHMTRQVTTLRNMREEKSVNLICFGLSMMPWMRRRVIEYFHPFPIRKTDSDTYSRTKHSSQLDSWGAKQAVIPTKLRFDCHDPAEIDIQATPWKRWGRWFRIAVLSVWSCRLVFHVVPGGRGQQDSQRKTGEPRAVQRLMGSEGCLPDSKRS